MTKPIDLPALQAKYDAATPDIVLDSDANEVRDAAGNLVASFQFDGDTTFLVAAHAAFPELLSMAEQRERLIALTQKDFAEKAAMAERLEIAMTALETIDSQVNVIDFHATALAEHAIARTALVAITEVKSK